MTLAELADRMWKKEHGDKTYEQVEAEYAARREKELAVICQDLPYRPAECEQNPGFKPMTSDEWRQYLSETWDKTADPGHAVTGLKDQALDKRSIT